MGIDEGAGAGKKFRGAKGGDADDFMEADSDSGGDEMDGEDSDDPELDGVSC